MSEKSYIYFKTSPSTMRKSGLITLLALFVFSTVSTQVPGIIFQENFNSNPPGWAQVPSPNAPGQVWQWTADGTGKTGPHWGNRSPINSISGPGAFIFNSDAYYSSVSNNYQDAAIEMPVLDCSGAAGVYLTFQQYYHNLSSITSVDISSDNGASWTGIPINNTVAPLQETLNGERVILNITSYAAGFPQVKIRFRFQGNLFFWIIDDILITDGLPNTDIGITGIAQPLDPCLLTNHESPKLVLTNYGQTAITQFQYRYTLNGTPSSVFNGIYSPPLQPGETRVYDPFPHVNLNIDLGDNTGYVLQFQVTTTGDSTLMNNSYLVELPPCPIGTDTLGGPYIGNQLIVKFIAGTTDSEKDVIRNKYNAVLTDQCLCDPGLELWDVDLTGSGITIEGVKDQASSESKIEDTGFNYIVKLDRPKDEGETPGEQAGQGPDGEVIRVAIIDSGVDFPHYDLSTSIWTNDQEEADPLSPDDDGNCFDYDDKGQNFVNSGTIPQDDNGHGSHIAGIIVKDLTLIPCARVEFISLKVMNQSGAGNLFHTLCAIYYASDKQTDIINYSAGYVGQESSMFRAAIDYAKSKNVIIVASAGNEGMDNDMFPHYPSQFSGTGSNVVSVAAFDDLAGGLANFSNKGQVVDIAAPGVSILSTIPGQSDNHGFGIKSGTSMAAAAVSRQLVLFKAANPTATYNEAIQFLLNNDGPNILGIGGGLLHEFGNCTVGVKESGSRQETPIMAFPNPFSDEFGIEYEWPENEAVQLSVFNAYGQRIKQTTVAPGFGVQMLGIDSRNWPAGTYFVFMESPHYRAREVAIKQR